MKYIFFLGRIPALSTAEIQSVLENRKIDYAADFISNNMLVLDIKNEVGLENIFPKMGGTVKIAKILNECDDYNNSFSEIAEVVKKLGAAESGKKIIGYSVYFTQNEDKNKVYEILIRTKDRFCKIKKELSEEHSVRIVFPDNAGELSTASLVNNKVIKKGAEFDFIFLNDKMILARTIAVQNIISYSIRDFGRPRRDARMGITPPKLCQIMLNLARTEEDATIFDPFCGIGSILQEALLDGYRVIGSDINEKQIYNCKLNLQWLLSRYPIKHPDYRIFHADSTNLFSTIEPSSIDAIVTESTLGPVYKKTPTSGEITENYRNLENIYLKFFASVKPLLKSGSRLVITIPAYKIVLDKYIFAPFVDKLEKIGYSIKCPLNEEFSSKGMSTTKRNSIIYSRPDQIVAREIIIFENK